MFLDDKPQGEVTEAPTKITRLSQAIRIGARLRPQCSGMLFRDGKSCAIGAAYEAMFGTPPEEVWGEWWRDDRTKKAHVVAWMRLRDVYCHATYSEVGSKNDEGWTREAIADWLEAQGL